MLGKIKIWATVIIVVLVLPQSCVRSENTSAAQVSVMDSLNSDLRSSPHAEAFLHASYSDSLPENSIHTGNLLPDSLLQFAKSLIGTPYKYASTNRDSGFDCSGFITYVFNHFQIQVPRSSKDFGNQGITIPMNLSRPGDLVLFTGTDSSNREIGHMGIIISNENGRIQFIHCSSGKAMGVTISEITPVHYLPRYVKTIRVLSAMQ